MGFKLDAQQISSSASTSAISTSTVAASTIALSQSTSITSSISSSTATNSSSSSTSPTSQTSANIDPTPLIPTASVVASTITSTQSLSATASGTAAPQAQSASSKTKSTTLTVLIAVAASVGGIAILWTIFRKWKLSSSKKFDRRLNPITNWQPTNGEDDNNSSLRRASSSSSERGPGEDHSANLKHDFTTGRGNTAPIGGYTDLARTSSTNKNKDNPLMQQVLGSSNHGYDVGVPLHYGYGTYNAHDYDYTGRSARY